MKTVRTLKINDQKYIVTINNSIFATFNGPDAEREATTCADSFAEERELDVPSFLKEQM